MSNSEKKKNSANKKTRKIQKFICMFLLVAMILPFIPEGALYVDALNTQFGPVTSATSAVNGSYISGKPGVYIVGDGYAIIWVTTFNGTGWLTYNKNGKEVTVYDERNGLLRTYDYIHVVKVPEADYDYLCNGYTVHSKQVTQHDYGITTYGVECSYSSRLKNTKPGPNDDVDLLTLTDVHGTAARANNSFGNYKKYFNNVDTDPDIVIFSGDLVSYLDATTMKQMFEIMGNATYGQYPIIYCRGNHETRGVYSTKMLEYFPTKTGELYFDFTFGSLWGVVIDTGEDKPDTHEAYGFLADYAVYLKEQENWLRSLRKPTDPNIKYRLGVYHMPRLETLARKVVFQGGSASNPVERFFFGTDISDSLAHLDLQFGIAGHEHRYKIYDNAQLYSSAIEGMTEAEVLEYMMAGDVTYKYTANSGGLKPFEYGGKEEYFKAGQKINFVPSSVKHKTFVAGGDWNGTAFVKLNASDGANGTATLYALTVEGNEVKVKDDGERDTSGGGTTFSPKNNPRKIDFAAPQNKTALEPTTSASQYGRSNIIKLKNYKQSGEYIISANYCTPSTTSTAISIEGTPAVFETGGDWYNVVWITNVASAGFVQFVYDGKQYQFSDEVSGKRRCEDRVHTVKVPKKFFNNCKYFVGNYTVNHQSGQLSYFSGNYCTSPQYVFEDRSNEKTPNILVYSNYKHENSVSKTLAQKAIDGLSSDYSFIAVTGDISYISAGSNKTGNPSMVPGNDGAFRDIFEAASALSGGTKLIVFSRGNAECRGFYATELIKYIPTVTGEFYYAFNYGDYTFVNLDTAEDSRETTEHYNGRVKTDAFYKKQSEWLDSILADKDNLKENIAALSHTPLYNMDIVNEGNSNFSVLNLDWGKKLKESGALINFAGSNIVPEVVKQDEGAEKFLFTISNGGLNYKNAYGTYNNYATAASVLLSSEYAYITFSQVAEKNGTYSGPFYKTYGNSSTKRIDTMLSSGEKVYSLKTGETVSYGAEAPTYETNSATGGKTYTVSSPSHLVWMAQKAAAGEHFAKDTFVLANHIDMMLYPFTPIGGFDCSEVNKGENVFEGTKYFSGTFDGKGYTIKNLNIVPKNSSGNFIYSKTENPKYNGIFGVVRNGHIKNLTVEGGYVKGGWDTGALAGYVDSTTTTPATVTNCYSNVTIFAPGEGTTTGASKAGGLIGNVSYNVTVSECGNYGNIKTTRTNGTCGGLIGEGFCYNNTATTGGTVGMGTIRILNCYNRGNLFNVNGFVGGILGNFVQTNGIIENCYSVAHVWGEKSGGILGTARANSSGSLAIQRCFYNSSLAGATTTIYTGSPALTYNANFNFKLVYDLFENRETYDSKSENLTFTDTENWFFKVSRKTTSGMKGTTFLKYINGDTTDNSLDTKNKYMLPSESNNPIKWNDGYPILKSVLSFHDDGVVLKKITLKETSGLALENGYLKGVVLGATVDSILGELVNESGISISKASTGGVISLTVGGEVVDSVVIVVKGDIDGDGEITSTDYLRVKGHFYGTTILKNEYFIAADIEENGTIDATDFIRIKSHFLGNYNIFS